MILIGHGLTAMGSTVEQPKHAKYSFSFMTWSELLFSAGKATMCLHTGMTDAYVWDLDTPQERVAGTAETRQILGKIDEVFRRQIGHLIYSHRVPLNQPWRLLHC